MVGVQPRSRCKQEGMAGVGRGGRGIYTNVGNRDETHVRGGVGRVTVTDGGRDLVHMRDTLGEDTRRTDRTWHFTERIAPEYQDQLWNRQDLSRSPLDDEASEFERRGSSVNRSAGRLLATAHPRPTAPQLGCNRGIPVAPTIATKGAQQ